MTPLVERWQGAGNIYLLVDARELSQPLTAATARALVAECGGDGVLELSAGSAGADVSMRIWNPDGSESEACGNGTRMVARWASERLGQADVSIDAFPLATQGPLLEHHPWFPERANVEITTVLDRHRLRMRVWERGVGETPACGSGACAAAVAAVTTGMADSPVTVMLPGGELVIEVGEDGSVTMHGPAERIESFELPPTIASVLV